MIIDTHAHYDDEQFDEDREEILGKMQDAGIGMIMDAGSTILSWDKIVKLTEEYPFVYGAIGVHPDEVGNLDETQFARMERLLDKEKIKRSEKSVWIIIGSGSHDVQKKWFVRQLDWQKAGKACQYPQPDARRIQWRSCVNMEKDCADHTLLFPIRRRWRQNMSRWDIRLDRRCCHI